MSEMIQGYTAKYPMTSLERLSGAHVEALRPFARARGVSLEDVTALSLDDVMNLEAEIHDYAGTAEGRNPTTELREAFRILVNAHCDAHGV